MVRHIKRQSDGKHQQIVAPGTLRFLDFARLRLEHGERYSGATEAREVVLDIFAGSASISIEPSKASKQTFSNAGGRPDVFYGPPTMIYIPPASKWEVFTYSAEVDIGVFSAPSASTAAPTLIGGSQVITRQVGRDNWQRTVYSAVDDRVPAERLLAGETLNPPGNWSSYPPHKHDSSNPPQEAVLEEIYFFRIKPAQGYGFIWTYTAPDDPDGFSTVFVVEDGDTVLLPKGYHPVVAAPGYELHYTWALAGAERRYGAWADDPKHAWVKK